MNQSKKAFTMIELIFVIVILGILAAVAVPRLAATRNDANVATAAQNIMTAAGEIASYAVSNGGVVGDLSVMSNAISSMLATGIAVLDIGNQKASIKIGQESDCVDIFIVTGVDDDNLTIAFKTPTLDSQCLNLQSKIDAQKFPMQLRGSLIKE